MQKFIWKENTRQQWITYQPFKELVNLCQNSERIICSEWLQDELDVVGELRLADLLLSYLASGKKYKNTVQSSIAYAIGLTDEAPISAPQTMVKAQYRKSPPDIDVDIEDRFREDVIAYTRQKYGYDHTASICTFSEMGAKKAIRDVARVLNYPYEIGDKISKAMPPALFGVSKTIDECLEATEFRNLYETDQDVMTIIDTAKQLEGLWRETGIHAAGLISLLQNICL